MDGLFTKLCVLKRLNIDMINFEYVVRTIGERTEEVCIELIHRQKAENEKVSILNESTHVDAIEKTFLLGLRSEADWLVAVDADMLLLPGGVSEMREEVKSCDANVFVAYPAVYDKLYSIRRWGVSLYRVSMLEELYDTFKELKNNHHLKIEGGAIKEVAKGKNEIFYSRKVVALHDFHQYYRDLYRKVYLNTVRNPGYKKKAEKNWEKISHLDADYLVMLQAMRDAKSENRELANSVNDFTSTELTDRIGTLGLKEKGPLLWRDYVDTSLEMSMENEIHQNEKYSVFTDYFENQSIVNKARLLFVKWTPEPILERYRRIKEYMKSKPD